MSLVSLPFFRGAPRVAWRETGKRVVALIPKGLYARSILIVILPMVILQSVLTFIFLERHWALVTNAPLHRADPGPLGDHRHLPVLSAGQGRGDADAHRRRSA